MIKIYNNTTNVKIEFGNGNFSNLVSVKESLEMGKKVLVMETRDISERDHTGGRASELYKKIIKSGAKRINNSEQLLDILKDL